MIPRIASLTLLFTICVVAFNACKSLSNTRYLAATTEYKMIWDGVERNYLVHLPPSNKMDKSLPILFHLHGGGGTAEGTPALTFGRFNELSNRDGFIVVYPNAIEKNWNDGRKSNKVKAWKENVDDVGFIVAIIEELKKKYNIDSNRIFTTGMSNGGLMSTRLVCDRSDIFRGAAILTAQISEDYIPHCNPIQPTAIMIMNGTADKIVPYDGGEIKVLGSKRGAVIPTDKFVDFWKVKNGCTSEISTTIQDKKEDGTSVTINEYKNCKNRGSLVHYKIEGGGHTWPGGKQYLGVGLVGKTSREINACEVIWDYFKSL